MIDVRLRKTHISVAIEIIKWCFVEYNGFGDREEGQLVYPWQDIEFDKIGLDCWVEMCVYGGRFCIIAVEPGGEGWYSITNQTVDNMNDASTIYARVLMGLLHRHGREAAHVKNRMKQLCFDVLKHSEYFNGASSAE